MQGSMAVGAAATVQMQVTIPPGLQAGSPFLVAAPDGSQVQVIVPPGMVGGMAITVEVPAAAAPPPMMMAPQPMQMMAQPMAQSVIPMGVPITPVMIQEALSLGVQDQVPLLDQQTMGILGVTSSFNVKQRVKFWEALSGGCCEVCMLGGSIKPPPLGLMSIAQAPPPGS